MGGRGRSSGGGGQAAQSNSNAATNQAASMQQDDYSQYGTLVQTYPNGTRTYEQVEVADAQEAADQRVLMNNVIKKDISEQLGVKRADIEMDKDTGLVTVWTGADPSANGFTQPSKIYYDTEITVKASTSVRADGTVKRMTFYDGVKLKYAGESF